MVGILISLAPYLGLAVGVVALILGILGIRKARVVGRGRGVAIAGVVTGAVTTAIGLALTISFMNYLADPSNTAEDRPEPSVVLTADPGDGTHASNA